MIKSDMNPAWSSRAHYLIDSWLNSYHIWSIVNYKSIKEWALELQRWIRLDAIDFQLQINQVISFRAWGWIQAATNNKKLCLLLLFFTIGFETRQKKLWMFATLKIFIKKIEKAALFSFVLMIVIETEQNRLCFLFS